VCTLASLVLTVAEQGLGSPAIVVIGDVVQASPHWAQRLLDEHPGAFALTHSG
jgi:siroheme synthase